MLFLICESKFVWAAMITLLLLAGRKGENTALIRCNLMSDMLAAYAAFAVTTCATRVFIASSGAWCTFHVWEERASNILLRCRRCKKTPVHSTFTSGKKSAHVLRLGRKSGQYLSRCRRWEKARAHSTFTSGKEEWTVFIEMSSLGQVSCAQHVYVWEE